MSDGSHQLKNVGADKKARSAPVWATECCCGEHLYGGIRSWSSEEKMSLVIRLLHHWCKAILRADGLNNLRPIQMEDPSVYSPVQTGCPKTVGSVR